jgi:hypothetical protein
MATETPSKIERRGMYNRGLQQHRFKQNPKEKKYALAWERENTSRIDENLDGRGVLDYLLAKNPNSPAGEVTERDREVAATVIQWLGSPCGQYFLEHIQEGKK